MAQAVADGQLATVINSAAVTDICTQQGEKGTIQATVTNASGGPVTGAVATLVPVDTTFIRPDLPLAELGERGVLADGASATVSFGFALLQDYGKQDRGFYVVSSATTGGNSVSGSVTGLVTITRQGCGSTQAPPSDSQTATSVSIGSLKVKSKKKKGKSKRAVTVKGTVTEGACTDGKKVKVSAKKSGKTYSKSVKVSGGKYKSDLKLKKGKYQFKVTYSGSGGCSAASKEKGATVK